MTLTINDMVQIILSPGITATDNSTLDNEFCTYFTTEMDPLYASELDVRRLVGAFVTEIPTDVINQLILEWSVMADDLADCIPDDKWRRYANKWVMYKVALVILYNTEDFRGFTGGKEFKQLGDFSLSRDSGGSDGGGIAKMIDWLECEAFKYEFSVRSCIAPAMNCLGLTDQDALPYKPKKSALVEKGVNDCNKPIQGREWIAKNYGTIRGNNVLYYKKRKYRTNIGTNEYPYERRE